MHISGADCILSFQITIPVIQSSILCSRVFQVNDEFLISLASEQSQIEFLIISGIDFSMEGLMYLRKVCFKK